MKASFVSIRVWAAVVCVVAGSLAAAPSARAADTEAQTVAPAKAGKRYILIIAARGGDQIQSDAVLEAVASAESLFEADDAIAARTWVFREGDVEQDDHRPITREAVLDACKELASTAGDGDETWVFLLGHANVNSRGFSLATRGPRLRGSEITEGLDAVPGRQVVFVLTRQSAALLEPLRSERRIVVSATDHPRQMNPPHLARFLLKAWHDKPDDALLNILREASRQTTAFYENRGMALPERMVIQDGETADLPPFDKLDDQRVARLRLGSVAGNTYAWTGQPAPVGATDARMAYDHDDTMADISRVALTVDVDESERVERPMHLTMPLIGRVFGDATPETKAIIAEADKLAKDYADEPAFFIERDVHLVINKDLSTRLRARETVRVNTPAGAAQYSTWFRTYNPADETLRLRSARAVLPDGRHHTLESDVAVASASQWSGRYEFGVMPPGSVLQIDYEIERRGTDNGLSLDHHLTLQQRRPVAATTVTIQTPKTEPAMVKVYGVDPTVTESASDYSVSRAMAIGPLPAWVDEPFGPNYETTAVRCHISALPSWKAMGEWAHRVMEGADAVDDNVKAFTHALTQDATTDEDKLRVIYEFLTSLRYQATPIGARACRPLLPAQVIARRSGDCKDKANALVAMANLVGIKGSRALLARGGRVDPDFPGWQFNHMLAYFPDMGPAGKGLWLDATDGSLAYGALPPGDIGRKALVLDTGEVGFKDVTLPRFGRSRIEQKITFDVADDGTFTGTFRHELAGLPDYHVRRALRSAGAADTRQFVQELVSNIARGTVVNDVSVTDITDLGTPTVITATIAGDNWQMTSRQLDTPLPWWDMTTMPQREHDLIINDGQGIAVVQEIRFKGAATMPASRAVPITHEGFEAGVFWGTFNGTPSRVARAAVPDGPITPAAYPAFRKQVHRWLDALAGAPATNDDKQ